MSPAHTRAHHFDGAIQGGAAGVDVGFVVLVVVELFVMFVNTCAKSTRPKCTLMGF